MIRRELSKIEFLDIAKGLALAISSFERDGTRVAAMRARELRALFEKAHTAYLEIEVEGQTKN